MGYYVASAPKPSKFVIQQSAQVTSNSSTWYGFSTYGPCYYLWNNANVANTGDPQPEIEVPPMKVPAAATLTKVLISGWLPTGTGGGSVAFHVCKVPYIGDEEVDQTPTEMAAGSVVSSVAYQTVQLELTITDGSIDETQGLYIFMTRLSGSGSSAYLTFTLEFELA